MILVLPMKFQAKPILCNFRVRKNLLSCSNQKECLFKDLIKKGSISTWLTSVRIVVTWWRLQFLKSLKEFDWSCNTLKEFDLLDRLTNQVRRNLLPGAHFSGRLKFLSIQRGDGFRKANWASYLNSIWVRVKILGKPPMYVKVNLRNPTI